MQEMANLDWGAADHVGQDRNTVAERLPARADGES